MCNLGCAKKCVNKNATFRVMRAFLSKNRRMLVDCLIEVQLLLYTALEQSQPQLLPPVRQKVHFLSAGGLGAHSAGRTGPKVVREGVIESELKSTNSYMVC